jgi:hypothetical protein
VETTGLEISQKFINRVGDVLLYEWDPIGVADTDCPKDEYQSYVPRVCKIALETTTLEPLANLLTRITVEKMGLPSKEERDIEIAKRIMEIKEELN